MASQKSCSECSDTSCGSLQQRKGEDSEAFALRQRLASRMCGIKHKILVLSGKGGVGKSTVAVNLAAALAMTKKRVGILDIDIHGPSVPRMLNLGDARFESDGTDLYPVKLACPPGLLSVVSVEFLLEEKDVAVIWRGPKKFGVIRQFLSDVDWGQLDYLIVDSPPGTGDEPLSVVQLIENADGAVVVTTPQGVAVQDVRRCIDFCETLKVPVLGVVENMSGYVCPHCSEHTALFGEGGGQEMAQDMKVPYLGSMPVEPDVVASGDSGKPMVQSKPHSETAKAINRIVRRLIEPELAPETEKRKLPSNGNSLMIAIPIAQGSLCQHFGHCEHFELFEVNTQDQSIQNRLRLTPPKHEPGVFPRWLHEQGTDVIISGGMGIRAQDLFSQNDIKVIVGAASGDPEQTIKAYLAGNLQTGANICDH